MGFREMFRNRDFCLSPNYIGVIDVANISELQTLTVCQTIVRHKNILKTVAITGKSFSETNKKAALRYRQLATLNLI